MRTITNFFLGIEERARVYFERFPFIQAFVAGIGVIIFWRGVWELLDTQGISPFWSILIGILLLGSVGVFIQTFIGNTIIIKNVKQEEKMEKKVLEKVEGEVDTEEVSITVLSKKLDRLIEKVSEIESKK
ncbi:MAG: hypothetical protein WCG55_03830 [bacterium]